MIAQEPQADKVDVDVGEATAQLRQYIHVAARQGTAAHTAELGLFRRLMSLGRKLFDEFLALQGSGDVGPEFTVTEGKTAVDGDNAVEGKAVTEGDNAVEGKAVTEGDNAVEGETVAEREVVQRCNELHDRVYTNIFGDFTLRRTVYSSGPQQKLVVPLDARLQLPDSKFSHLLQSWDQLVATEQPYSQVSRVFETIFQLHQHVDSLERTSRRLSPDAEAFCWSRPVPPAAEEGPLLVESADGKGVPIRHAADAPPIQDHQHRPGPKPDRKRMATVGAVYSVDPFVRTPEQVLEALFHDPAEPRSPDLPDRPRPQHKWTYARLDDDPAQADAVKGQAAVFGWLDEQLRARRQQRPGAVVICLMDGQESLWSMKAKMQPDVETIEVLDLLHVTPRLWTAAKLFHPRDQAAATGFVREQVDRILHGQVKTVLHSLRARATRRGLSKEKQASLAEICGYFRKHAERMRYDEYLAAGYPIASGVIEGACRHVVKDRLERTGMSWTRAGAQAMLHLRAIWTCDQWDEFEEYRIARETTRLYPYRETLSALEWPIAA